MSTTLRPPVVLVKAKGAYAAWFKILADFPKVYRYNLGGKIENSFLSLLENIFVASYLSGDKKGAQLSLAIIKLDNLKFFTQLAWENKCLANNKYTALSEQLDEIGRMLGGWKKGLEMKTPSR
jgi:hypothetical protein